MSFDQFSSELQLVLKGLGFKKPTGIQELAFPVIRDAKDCLIIAPTGFGKTEAALLPLIDRLMLIPKEERKAKGIWILYITPLKALNRDIYRRVLPQICEKVDVSIAVRHGDTTASQRRKQTEKPPEILILTPEMLQAILPAKIIGKRHLVNVRTVIIDECHDLVDSKRGSQLTIALERLQELTQRHFQRIGLSATVGTPSLVAQFIAPNSHSMEILTFEAQKQMDLTVYSPIVDIVNDKKLSKILWSSMDTASKFRAILEIIRKGEGKTTLLFTNTRQMAEVLSFRFNRYNEVNPDNSKINIETHHSSLAKDVRITAEKEFREGKLDLVIATSSLELGIDIGAVDQVIQYMSPRRVETLVQRVGRSGHKFHERSKGFIVPIDDRDALEAVIINYLAKKGNIEKTRMIELSLDVLLHQIVGILRDKRNITLREIYNISIRAFPYRRLSWEVFVEVVEFGAERHLFMIFEEDNGTHNITRYLSLKRRGLMYYFENLSTIADTRQFIIKDISSGRRVGVLDEKFVITAEKGLKFILKGYSWRVLAIDEEKGEIRVQPERDFSAAIPSWQGELIPVSNLVTYTALQILNNLKSIGAFSIYSVTKSKLLDFQQKLSDLKVLPTPSVRIIESAGSICCIHTFLGSRTNEALAVLLTSLIETRSKFGVIYQADAYTITIKAATSVVSMVKESLMTFSSVYVRPFLDKVLRNSDLFAWRFKHVAHRMSLIKKESKISHNLLKALIRKYGDSICGTETLNELYFDKLDVGGVEEFLEAVQKGKINITIVQVKELKSPLALGALDSSSMHIIRGKPSAAILAAVEKRLLNTWVQIVCMNLSCNFSRVIRISALNEIIECHTCHQRYIAVISESSPNVKAFLRKEQRGEELLPDERKRLRDAKRSADLILTYGKRAAFVLAGRGIGPKTAVRVLREPYSTNESSEMVENILEAEASYTRTREYW